MQKLGTIEVLLYITGGRDMGTLQKSKNLINRIFIILSNHFFCISHYTN